MNQTRFIELEDFLCKNLSAIELKDFLIHVQKQLDEIFLVKRRQILIALFC